jgi:hypothetical protein
MQFRTFFGCMLSHQEYYQPFLDAFHVDIPRSQDAIDRAADDNAQPDSAASSQQPAVGRDTSSSAAADTTAS